MVMGRRGGEECSGDGKEEVEMECSDDGREGGRDKEDIVVVMGERERGVRW